MPFIINKLTDLIEQYLFLNNNKLLTASLCYTVL